jgi:hypothetical protein
MLHYTYTGCLFFFFTASVGEYKASLYALMTYSHQGDLKTAEPVARYLFYRSHLLDRHTEVIHFIAVQFSGSSHKLIIRQAVWSLRVSCITDSTLEYDTASVSNQILMFETTQWHKIIGSEYPLMQHNIPEEQNPQLHRCKNPKTHISSIIIRVALDCDL